MKIVGIIIWVLLFLLGIALIIDDDVMGPRSLTIPERVARIISMIIVLGTPVAVFLIIYYQMEG